MKLETSQEHLSAYLDAVSRACDESIINIDKSGVMTSAMAPSDDFMVVVKINENAVEDIDLDGNEKLSVGADIEKLKSAVNRGTGESNMTLRSEGDKIYGESGRQSFWIRTISPENIREIDPSIIGSVDGVTEEINPEEFSRATEMAKTISDDTSSGGEMVIASEENKIKLKSKSKMGGTEREIPMSTIDEDYPSVQSKYKLSKIKKMGEILSSCDEVSINFGDSTRIKAVGKRYEGSDTPALQIMIVVAAVVLEE